MEHKLLDDQPNRLQLKYSAFIFCKVYIIENTKFETKNITN